MNKKLLQKRQESRFTQKEVAKESNISLRYYQYLEAGTKQPTIPIAQSIANVLKCKMEDIFSE